MRQVFFLLLFCLTAAAAEPPEPPPTPACGPWYARLAGATKNAVVGTARSGKDSVVGAARSAKASVLELKENVRREGPLRILVRKRTEAEKALGYRSYFVAPPAPENTPRFLLTRALAQVRRLNPARNLTPVRGVISSLDRAFLPANYTATNGIRGAAAFAGGTAVAIALTELLYEKPMAYLEETIPFERAVSEGLDAEYSFKGLREKIAAGTLTRAEAEEKVRDEYHARGRYFDLVRLALESTKAKSMEEIAPHFTRLLNAPKLGSAVSDLRYFLSEAFRKNPRIALGSAEPVSAEQFGRLFALNHAKVYASASLNKWMQGDFKPASLPADSAELAIYREVTEDPFRAKLIAYQKAHPAAVPASKLIAWLAEDLEWSMRFAELEVLGAEMRASPGGEARLTLGDRRAEFSKKNGLSL